MSGQSPCPPPLHRAPAITRRTLIHAGVLGAACCTVWPTLAAAGAADPAKQPPQAGDLLSFASWEDDSRAVTPDDVLPGAEPLLVYPADPTSGVIREQSRLNQILLLRFGADELSDAMRALGAAGLVAYSGLCTHTACGVSGWDAEARHLVCPCHGSTFDPLHAGQRIAGPAPRALPALPIALAGDTIVVAGVFTATVGAKS